MNFPKSDVQLLMVQGKMASKSKDNLISVLNAFICLGDQTVPVYWHEFLLYNYRFPL